MSVEKATENTKCNGSLCLEVYILIPFRLSIEVVTTDIYMLIPVLMSFSSFKVLEVQAGENTSAYCIVIFLIDLYGNQHAAETFWSDEALAHLLSMPTEVSRETTWYDFFRKKKMACIWKSLN